MWRIVSAVALLTVVAAGCGGADRPQRLAVHEVPRALAQAWESRASAISTAAAAGDNCSALQLANALRADVIAKRQMVPLRLRTPLLTGVNALASRVTCVVTAPIPPKKQPKPPHDHHDRHGHHGHGDGGGNEQ